MCFFFFLNCFAPSNWGGKAPAGHSKVTSKRYGPKNQFQGRWRVPAPFVENTTRMKSFQPREDGCYYPRWLYCTLTFHSLCFFQLFYFFEGTHHNPIFNSLCTFLPPLSLLATELTAIWISPKPPPSPTPPKYVFLYTVWSFDCCWPIAGRTSSWFWSRGAPRQPGWPRRTHSWGLAGRQNKSIRRCQSLNANFFQGWTNKRRGGKNALCNNRFDGAPNMAIWWILNFQISL